MPKPEHWKIDGERGGATGHCHRCHRPFPAIALVPVDQWVPRRNGPPVHIYGWHCGDCRPRDFGRVRGYPAAGISMPALDGSEAPGRERGLPKFLTPLGDAGRNMNPRIQTRHRTRKLPPMKPLN